eukprot:XP_006536414.1 PREDICTED: uncharacterized protein Gm21064 isoform X5 [Mus musculus]
MALKKLMVISKEGYLLLLDFDDEDDDIKVSEEALAEVKSPGFDKNENISPQAEADEYMGDEVDSMLDKSGEMKLTVCWLHLEVFSPENTGLQHLRILLLEGFAPHPLYCRKQD